jgi:hypothetical protein
MVIIHSGPGTDSDYAGKDQRQFFPKPKLEQESRYHEREEYGLTMLARPAAINLNYLKTTFVRNYI